MSYQSFQSMHLTYRRGRGEVMLKGHPQLPAVFQIGEQLAAMQADEIDWNALNDDPIYSGEFHRCSGLRWDPVKEGPVVDMSYEAFDSWATWQDYQSARAIGMSTAAFVHDLMAREYVSEALDKAWGEIDMEATDEIEEETPFQPSFDSLLIHHHMDLALGRRAVRGDTAYEAYEM